MYCVKDNALKGTHGYKVSVHMCKVEISLVVIEKGKNILSGPADETFWKQYQIIKCQDEFTHLSEWWIVLHEIPLGNKPSQLAFIGSRGYWRQQRCSEYPNRLRASQRCESEERLCQIKYLGTLEWGSTQTKLLFFFIIQLSRQREAQRGMLKIVDLSLFFQASTALSQITAQWQPAN